MLECSLLAFLHTYACRAQRGGHTQWGLGGNRIGQLQRAGQDLVGVDLFSLQFVPVWIRVLAWG